MNVPFFLVCFRRLTLSFLSTPLPTWSRPRPCAMFVGGWCDERATNRRSGSVGCLQVDGSGWCWQLLETRLPHQRRELLGDLDAIDAAVVAQITEWRAAGCTPLVFFDGRQRFLKAETAAKRHVERQRKEEALESICFRYKLGRTQDELPIPPLLSKQVQASLQRERVEVRGCKGQWGLTGRVDG